MTKLSAISGHVGLTILLIAGCDWKTSSTCDELHSCVKADAGNSGGSATGGIGTGGSHSGGGSSLGGSNAGGSNAGASSSGGNGTGGITSVCNPACSGTKPVCNESAKTCVECTADGNCTGAKPACNLTTNSCVQCTKDGNCSGTTPVCDTTASVCVQCTKDANCSSATPVCKTASDADSGAGPAANTCVQCTKKEHCPTAAPLCDTAKNVCVECLTSSDCTDAAASACINSKCEPCVSNSDCAHLPGKTVCDTSAVSNNVDAGPGDGGTNGAQCVQCKGTDYAACSSGDAGTGQVCDSLKNTCSDNIEHSSDLCQPCVSDAQCKAGELCVEQKVNGKSLGYFCFWKQGDTNNSAPADCTLTGRPYVSALSVTSIDGQVATICSLAATTCIAMNQYRSANCASPTNTPDDNLCGVLPSVDSKCTAYGASQFLCTVACLSDFDCPIGGVTPITCIGAGGTRKYCSL